MMVIDEDGDYINDEDEDDD